MALHPPGAMTKDAENARKAALLERAKARKRAKEQAERTGASPLPAASSAARRDPAQQHADATRLERAFTDKSAEATRVSAARPLPCPPQLFPPPLLRQCSAGVADSRHGTDSGGRLPPRCARRRTA